MYTVRQIRNALMVLSNSKTRSIRKRQAYARLNRLLDYVGWDDQTEVTHKDLLSIPSIGKKTVDIVFTEMHIRGPKAE